MTELLELRVNREFSSLLFAEDEGKNLGSVKIVQLSQDDPRRRQVPLMEQQLKRRYNKAFFFGWQIRRSYSKMELDAAALLHVKIKTEFEPAGETCGTSYDAAAACPICGAHAEQQGPLILKKGALPPKDIARTISGEVVVSGHFVHTAKQWGINGLTFNPVHIGGSVSDKWYQLHTLPSLDLSPNTITGINPWDHSEKSDGGIYDVSGYEIAITAETYKCPKGHTIGLNLLSEPSVITNDTMPAYDFCASRQMLGVRRGLLRPEPIYFCSQHFRQMVTAERLAGFVFEVANIVRNECTI